MSAHRPVPSARVIAVQDDIVVIEAQGEESETARPLMKNEMIHILPRRLEEGRQVRLQGEILRVKGATAEAQVFESTVGVAVGDPVEQQGELLSVWLGPGLLGQIYDGLQNPLEKLAAAHGNFLLKGSAAEALDLDRKWAFAPSVREGDRLRPGAVLGTVREGVFTHKIMVPFDLYEEVAVTWIQGGNLTIDTPLARIRGASGEERSLTMLQRWPVRRPLAEGLLRHGYNQRLYPDEPLTTTLRLVDTFFPIARGGTGCIPGPFGAGKTVLQSLISRYADVDLVIVVACGERAGEVVETINELPRMKDPRSGGSLMDRTIIVCNTSSMPVAAREASIYTGVTLGEYYRQMGYDVLLLADSTSRWAQAMRETSGRMEEIPGEEAFPAYLDSAIRGVYERAGLLQTSDGARGSLTLLGTVSPAGGNFEEPVTQSTLNTVKCFLGLSYDRAYRRFYPAVDPLISWSRYLDQLAPWYARQIDPLWTERVKAMLDLLKRGDAVGRMMQVTGEEGVTLADYVIYQKAVFLDMVYLQQDAFDPVDVSTPRVRQKIAFFKVFHLVNRDYGFTDKAQARHYFTRLSGLFRNFNYAAEGSADYQGLLERIDQLAAGIPEFAMGAP